MTDTFYNLITVAAGGAFGSVARYLVSISPIAKNSTSFPTSTLSVNLIGSFLIGFLFIFLDARYPANVTLKLFLIVGFLGAFTTFSTFELELWNQIEQGKFYTATTYLFASILLGFAGVVLGILIGKRFT